MKILVNGAEAVIKQNSSFDYIAENRLFLGRDGYTLSITFPLKDCPPNRQIFGHISRIDIRKPALYFECMIQDRGVALSGSLLVTNITDVEVTCQFAEGRCEQTATSPFEDIKICSLDLGQPETISPALISPSEAWVGLDGGKKEVALPWINEAYPDVPNNEVSFKDDKYSWTKDTTKLSWQPYLIEITRRICEALGYECDLSEWEQSDLRYLIVCNTLPASWDVTDYAAVLPNWTVSEYFEKLELFLFGEFDFDHRAKTMRFEFSDKVVKKLPDVCLNDIVDSYSVEVSDSDDDNCEYIGVKKLAYKSCSHSMWKYYSCDKFISGRFIEFQYDTLESLIEHNRREEKINSDGSKTVVWGDQRYLTDPFGKSKNNVNVVLYARDIDTRFIFRSVGTELVSEFKPFGDWVLRRAFCQVYVLQPVNIFGSGVDDDREATEIEFVPACIMDTDETHGQMLFLSFSEYNEPAQLPYEVPADYVPSKNDIVQPMPAQSIIDWEDDDREGGQYYDEIIVGFWDGVVPEWGKSPYPVIDTVIVKPDWTFYNTHLPGLRLSGSESRFKTLQQVNPRQKFKISWLSSSIPDVRSVFFIKGQRYICEKITATFTENGMSQLLKGEFYPLVDD